MQEHRSATLVAVRRFLQKEVSIREIRYTRSDGRKKLTHKDIFRSSRMPKNRKIYEGLTRKLLGSCREAKDGIYILPLVRAKNYPQFTPKKKESELGRPESSMKPETKLASLTGLFFSSCHYFFFLFGRPLQQDRMESPKRSRMRKTPTGRLLRTSSLGPRLRKRRNCLFGKSSHGRFSRKSVPESLPASCLSDESADRYESEQTFYGNP